MEQASHQDGRESAAVSRVIQVSAVLASVALTGLLFLGLAIVMSEYRPSAVSLVQQAIVAFAVASVSMCLSAYLLVRPLRHVERSPAVYILLFAAIGSSLAIYLRESWEWDLPGQLLAFVGVLSTVASGCVVVGSVRGEDV